MTQSKDQFVKLASAYHPHGIKGEVELRLLNPDPEESILEEGMTVRLYPGSASSGISPHGEDWLISKLRIGNKVICLLKGITDRTHLEGLLPFEVFLDRKDFPEADEGEVYLVDLVGMIVVNEAGEKIGVLESFSDNGMQYLFDVRLDPVGEKITLPYVDTFFPKIDLEKKQITMILPEYTE